ncbi:unnamed protein product [Durusdinium trenchii]|uniref:Uncharacterized protein n=1 Tax=Durusdinium trenchii TaxID=1381693 RepID=A0ABP0J5P5_9DINO
MLRLFLVAAFCVGCLQLTFVRPLNVGTASHGRRQQTYLRSAGKQAGADSSEEQVRPRRWWGLGFVAAALAALRFRVQPAKAESYPVQGNEELMKQKAHGTTEYPVQEVLRWDVDRGTADRICSYNRHFAEYAGYWSTTKFLKQVNREGETFYDSVSGKPLFVAPKGRTWKEFEKESFVHGWPSFRDEEVIWENVRCLPGGECVSIDGTHLGHNIPDFQGNRYCINLVSVAGNPPTV